jgi:hypothetical protein
VGNGRLRRDVLGGSEPFPVLLFGGQRRRSAGELHLLKLCHRRCHVVEGIGRYLRCCREDEASTKKKSSDTAFRTAIFRGRLGLKEPRDRLEHSRVRGT